MSKKVMMFEYLEVVAPIMPFPIYWADINSRVLGVNEACLEAMGATSYDAVVGKTPYEYYPLEIAENITNHVKAVIQTQKTLSQEDRIKGIMTGEIRYFTATRGPIFDSVGKIVGIVGVSIEITAEKKAEKLKEEKLLGILKEQEKFTALAGQVAHDIASPTAALAMLVENCNDIPEEIRLLLRETAARITDIAHNLLAKYKPKSDATVSVDEPQEELLLSTTILQILAEKRLQYAGYCANLEYVAHAKSNISFILMQPSAFGRMLSNIINNAIEALDHQDGKVVVRLDALDDHVKVIIEDTGQGMPLELVDKILRNINVSEGKLNGHGIGLAQVREALNRNQGVLSIDSVLGVGSKITLTFPRIPAPLWLAEEIKFKAGSLVIILDDDQSIHKAWDSRFESFLLAHIVEIKHFQNGEKALDFINGLSVFDKDRILLLADYELLKQNLTGLDVIIQSGIKHSILVTSHYAIADIREQAAKVGAKILPKQLASDIAIVID